MDKREFLERLKKIREMEDSLFEEYISSASKIKVGDKIQIGQTKGVVTSLACTRTGLFHGTWKFFKKDGSLCKNDTTLNDYQYEHAIKIN